MHRLVQGFRHFRRNVFPQQTKVFKDLANQQKPHTMIITCSDSRIMPERIFTTEPGDLFVYRNIGNIVPPYTHQVSGEIAAIEFAVTVLKVEHIVICGHSDCGAMKAALHPEKAAGMPSVSAWLKHAARARHVFFAHNHTDEKDHLRCLTEENVIAQLDHLRTLPVVAAALTRGTLELHGWVYDIPDAILNVYNPREGKFIPLDENSDHMPDAAVATVRTYVTSLAGE